MGNAQNLINDIDRGMSAEELIGPSRKKTKGKFVIKTKRFKLKQSSKAQKKFSSITKRTGRGLMMIGKKVAPVVKKQARLIRQQQLRDDAIQRKLSKRPKVKTQTKKPTGGLDLFSKLDF